MTITIKTISPTNHKEVETQENYSVPHVQEGGGPSVDPSPVFDTWIVLVDGCPLEMVARTKRDAIGMMFEAADIGQPTVLRLCLDEGRVIDETMDLVYAWFASFDIRRNDDGELDIPEWIEDIAPAACDDARREADEWDEAAIDLNRDYAASRGVGGRLG